ncbi:MAG: NmrA family NAD(P)-binding protein [Ignavibacteriae bacterium]|nr:NmrA family NAD(P)-binding protein [Ignavibacteriota bacterium]MCB9211362.1 NmrA family NAD(P)-binding protein [Ignavibacteriales bacterium]MCB9219768.1 NmrA family NAD(P)-binding protein [Ignavibacteriales bacterium]MCB9260029.1 NmrA family NAD(P)-binding protein [Ignavibacteriales bacterium]
MENNILVIGGTGKTGRRVAEKLIKLNQNVRIGSRNNSPSFDWENTTTYSEALKGIDRAYITYYPDLAVPGAKEAINTLTEIALKSGLEKVVLLSGKGEKEAEACEEIVANSGLNYTLVRASWFNQNFSESFFLDPILAGHVELPMAAAEIPFVDADDIAEAVVKVLLDDSYNNQTITITGPRKLTFREAIQEISNQTKKSINFRDVTLDNYIKSMKNAGLPKDYVWLIGYLFKEVLGNHENQIVSNDIEKVIGRKAVDFSEFVKKTTQTGVWNQSIVSSL